MNSVETQRNTARHGQRMALLPAIASFLALSCATTAGPVSGSEPNSKRSSVRSDHKPDASFSRYTTYAWVVQPRDGDPTVDAGAELRRLLRLRIERGLARGGLLPAAPNTEPDLKVAYFTNAIEGAGWISTWGHAYVPWEPEMWGYGYGRWLDDWSPGVAAQRYQDGTIVIDLIDNKSDRLVWRGWGRGPADRRQPQAELFQLVERIMRMLPFRR